VTSKSKGSSIRQKLIALSRSLRIPYQNLETSFLIERLVARLTAQAYLSKNLVFKGGFVGLRVYHSSRYTVDLDALIFNSDSQTTLKQARHLAEFDLNDGVWFRFEEQVNLVTQGEYGGIRQVYRAGIGEILKDLSKAQIVNFDLGIGDPVTPSPIQVEMKSLLSTQESLNWLVYPIETIVAEKLHALITLGNFNSRSKDVFDLSVFLPRVDSLILYDALKECFEFRKTPLPKCFSEEIQSIDTVILKRGWLSAMVSMNEAIKFEEAYEKILFHLRNLERAFPERS
jgi:hypothetical protein